MAFVPSAKMIARKRGIDVESLIDILSYRRPYNSLGDIAFMERFLDTVKGMKQDAFGNRFIRIPNADGTQSNVMWSCHTDSVHAPIKNGVIRQNIKWDEKGNILGLNQGKPGQCLGADDGAGIWLMLQMLEEGKPGLYVFHVGEEVGGKGSRYIVKETPELVNGIDFCIAFDRKDVDSIITFQGGDRCCSDAFGNSLGIALGRVDGMKLKLDTTGSFTDSAVYTDLVAECTNVSVGYYSQHGPRETLDVRHMIKLRDALMQLDPEADLVIERKAGERESKWKSYGYGGNQGSTYASRGTGRWDRQQKKWVYDDEVGKATPPALTAPAKTPKPTLTVVGGKAPLTKTGIDPKEQSRLIAQAAAAEVMDGRPDPDDEDAYNQWLIDNFDRPDDRTPSGKETEVSLFAKLCMLLPRFPEAGAVLLVQAGFNHHDLADAALQFAFEKAGVDDDEPVADADLAGDDTHGPDTICESCTGVVKGQDVGDDLRCPYCYASLVDPIGEALALGDTDKAMSLHDAQVEAIAKKLREPLDA